MKKFLILMGGVLLTFAFSSQVSAVEYPLYAGQDTEVGEVLVTNDAENLYVKYIINEEGWEITETHVAVGCDKNNIPRTTIQGKKGTPSTLGGPIPGQFKYSMTHDPAVNEYTEKIPLADFTCTDDIIVATHAAIQQPYDVEVIITVPVTESFDAPYYPTIVSNYVQGTKKDGSPVDIARSLPEQGLAFETGQNPSNFFSLGKEGFIVSEFSCPLVDSEGSDLRLIEDTWGTYPIEKAEVFLSMTGEDETWTSIGYADNTVRDPVYNIHTTTYFEIPDDLEGAKYIKIVDVTDFASHNASSDGYDLNAIEVLQNCSYTYDREEIITETIYNYESAWGAEDVAVNRFVKQGNWATYMTYDKTLEGDWLLNVNNGAYLHDMLIVTQDSDGTISGTGGYPSTDDSPYLYPYNWTLSGQLTESSISMTIKYQNGYTATITGTVAPDLNSMSGGIGTGGVTSWFATRL